MILLFSDAASGPNLEATLLASNQNCDVLLLTDPLELMLELSKGDVDLVLIDIDNTPEFTVENMLPEIKANFSSDKLPILVLCHSDQLEHINSALDLEATDYLSKPLKTGEVFLRIRNALALKSSQIARKKLEQEVKTRTAKLNMLIESGLMMSMEKNRDRLLEHILHEGQKLLNCDGGTMYLVTKNNTLRFAVRTRNDLLPFEEITLSNPATGAFNDAYVCAYAANHKKTVVIHNIYQETEFDFSGTRDFDAQTGYSTVSLLTIPMAPRKGHVIGILQFINALDPDTGEIIPFEADVVNLVEALAAQAAVALDNLQLIEGQKSTTESIIHALAAAIDTKSPHTAHHCVRVPELAIMLAEAACQETQGPLAEFNFETEDQWLEFRVGAWLHDCGKVTTPEYVMEKATKLDMLYNRIHEIRMRFEVLLRDAEIQRLESLLNGVDADDANRRFEDQKTELFDDFAFIAECNMGRESMHSADLKRIQQIAVKTWLRYFDDCQGLSQQDTMLLQLQPKQILPVQEQLLADKPKHVIPRPCHQIPDTALGIKMIAPEHLFNHGEIYNLSIQRGTLNAEDRYKINEHTIETINLLEKVPFPDFLKRVPEYATTHHETLDGRGYPRQLTAKDLSIPSRIMAVADIFEAITASDRPYKKPYKLSESLKILSQMKKNQHIDADVFELFLRSGVYMKFAQKYLLPEQIDHVDILDFIQPKPH